MNSVILVAGLSFQVRILLLAIRHTYFFNELISVNTERENLSQSVEQITDNGYCVNIHIFDLEIKFF